MPLHAAGEIADGLRTAQTVTISGSGFRLDASLRAGLESVGDSLALDIPDGALLTGVLADGTPFAFSPVDSDSFAPETLTLKSSESPPVGPPLITASTDPVPFGIRQGQVLVVDNGGVVEHTFNAGPASKVTVEEGGVVGDNFEAVDAEVTVSGGSAAGPFHFQSGSEVNLIGTEFLIDGEKVANFVINEPVTVSEIIDEDATLSGYFSDGAPFSFKLNGFSEDAILKLTLVPEPSCIVLAIAGILLGAGWLRERMLRR